MFLMNMIVECLFGLVGCSFAQRFQFSLKRHYLSLRFLIIVCVLSTSIFSQSSLAAEYIEHSGKSQVFGKNLEKAKASSSQAYAGLSFGAYLQKVVNQRRGVLLNSKPQLPPTAESFLVAAISRILTDDVKALKGTDEEIVYTGHEEEIKLVLEVLSWPSRAAILVGTSGVGKTTVVDQLAQMLVSQKYPQSEIYKKLLDGADIIETTPGKLSQLALSNEPSAQSAAFEMFFKSVRLAQANRAQLTGEPLRPIIVFIDDIDSLDPPQLQALKREAQQTTAPIMIIGTARNESLELKLKKVRAVRKSLELIPVEEFSIAKTKTILKGSWLKVIARKYKVSFSDASLDTLMKVSRYIYPEFARPEGPFRLARDLAIRTYTLAQGKNAEVTDKMIYDYVQKLTGIPSDPRDAKAFDAYLKSIEKTLNERVINQAHLSRGLVKTWSQILVGNPTKPQTHLILGPTGSGKTLIAQAFADTGLGKSGRFFEIDGTALEQGEYSLGTYFGVPVGLKAGEQSSGTLMEWLDDPSRGKYGGIILINEAEKMPPEVWKRLMEFMDRGVIYGGDGEPRYANRHMIIMTSNRGTKEIFPDTSKLWSNSEISNRITNLKESDLKEYFLRTDPGTSENVVPIEVMGRIDHVQVAHPVTKESSPSIVKTEINLFAKELNLKLKPTEALVKHLSVTGIDTLYGARPLKKMISTYFTEVVVGARKNWSIEDGVELDLDLLVDPTTRKSYIQVKYKGQSFNIQAPEDIRANPLEDPEYRKKMRDLGPRMRSIMVEQPEATDALVRALNSKAANDARRRPNSLTLLGTTGLGKSAMGFALAESLYGEASRCAIISLGHVQNAKGLETVFGSKNDKTPFVFENTILKNPQGGVIMFDEFSNMGGSNLEVKKALLYSFYEMLEEGTWTSPRNGRVYDLSKFTFIFTGNDLEELLQGVSSDELRMAKWNEINTREKIQAHLLTKGVPEPLIGRQLGIILLRPLVGEGQARVTDLLLNETKSQLEKQNQGLKITWEKDFHEKLAKSHFSHDRGARSVRTLIEYHMPALVTELIVESDIYNFSGIEMHYRMTDNASHRAYSEKEANAREVVLYVDMIQNGKKIAGKELLITSSANKQIVMSKEEARKSALYYVGRALANDPLKTGQQLDFLSTKGAVVHEDIQYGFIQFKDIPGRKKSQTKSAVVARLAALWGGRLLLEKQGLEPDVEWQKDLAIMRKMATEFLRLNGSADGLEAVETDEDGQMNLSPEQRKAFQTELKALFDMAKKVASENIAKYEKYISALVEEIMKKDELNRDVFVKITGIGSCAVTLTE